MSVRRENMYALSRGTRPASRGSNLPDLPATVVPIQRSETGLPIGVQIVGPHLEDRTTIAFAQLLEREFGGFVPPPRI